MDSHVWPDTVSAGPAPRPRTPGHGSDLSEGQASLSRGSLPESAHPGGLTGVNRMIQDPRAKPRRVHVEKRAEGQVRSGDT